MTGQPTVSVVVPYSPAHTPDRMLSGAKASVAAQSVPTETIVVEDDHQRGPAWARNQGLERASTRYVAFLDADDLWKPDKLERQIDCLERTGAGISVEGTHASTDEFARKLFVGEAVSLTSSILIDTSTVDVRFEETLARREDHLFILEAASEAGVCFDTDLVEIRKHDRGLSSETTAEVMIDANLRFVELVRRRVDEELVTRHGDEVFRLAYRIAGRIEHQNGNYGAAIVYLLVSLSFGLSIENVGAMGLSVGAYALSVLVPDRFQ